MSSKRQEEHAIKIGHRAVLPESYCNIIDSIVDSSKNKFKFRNELIGFSIPTFGEALYIGKTLENLTKRQMYIDKENLLIIVVYKRDGKTDKTIDIVKNYVKETGYKILAVDEEQFPDDTCIGHARSIGFGVCLALAHNFKIPLTKVFLFSSDADLLDIDQRHINKYLGIFRSSEKTVLSCQNNFTGEANRNPLLLVAKVIENVFFESQFIKLGALNGRCYAVRGDVYVGSGGVNYLARYDDISFGISLSKKYSSSVYQWVESNVITSERRYIKHINSGNIIEGYGRNESIGNTLYTLEDAIDLKNNDKVVRKLINEGINTTFHYYIVRYENEDISGLIVQALTNYVDSLNAKFKEILRIRPVTSNLAITFYNLSISKGTDFDWWNLNWDVQIDYLY